MLFKKILSYFILIGWKNERVDPNTIKGSVLIASPHTSNWDFPFTIAYFWSQGLDIKFVIKDYFTNHFFIGWLIKWMGGIGVDRSQKNNLIDYCANLFKENPDLILLITPEGTRSRSEKWKLGFYHIALKADVPISLGYVDYKKKSLGIPKKLYPNLKSKRELFDEIQAFYKDINGKIPENFTPNIE